MRNCCNQETKDIYTFLRMSGLAEMSLFVLLSGVYDLPNNRLLGYLLETRLQL